MNTESDRQAAGSRQEPNPFHALSWLIGTAIGKVCFWLWLPFLFLLNLVQRMARKQADVVVTPIVEPESTVAVVVKDAEVAFEPPVSTTATAQASDILHLPFEGDFGRMVLWLDRKQRSVRRRIEISDKTLIKKMGWIRQELPILAIPKTVKATELTRFAIDRSYLDAEKIFNGQSLPHDAEEEPPKKTVSIAPPKVEAPTVQHDDLTADEADPSFVQVVPKKPRIALVSNNVQAPEATFQGIVLDVGEMERVLPGKPPFTQYGVRLQDSVTGLPHEVWGTDLKRAIDVSKAQVGDTVLIKKMGSVRIKEGTDRSCFKGRFEVVKA